MLANQNSKDGVCLMLFSPSIGLETLFHILLYSLGEICLAEFCPRKLI